MLGVGVHMAVSSCYPVNGKSCSSRQAQDDVAGPAGSSGRRKNPAVLVNGALCQICSGQQQYCMHSTAAGL